MFSESEGTTQDAPIFFSWQSDTDGGGPEGIVAKALRIATTRVAEDVDVSVRPDLDHDTKGVPGAPSMIATILEKIDRCAIFVADVTLGFHRRVGTDKLSPNPNVLVELGYALHRLGPSRILLVLDATYGGPEHLPFDLRGHRAIVFSSSVSSGSVAERLADDLEEGIRGIFRTRGLPDDLRPALAVELHYLKEKIESARHDYRLQVVISNHGSEIIRDCSVDLRFPRALLNPTRTYPIVRSDEKGPFVVMRRTMGEVSGQPLYPGDSETVLGVDYLMDHRLYGQREELFPLEVVATAFVGDKQVARTARAVRDLQVF